MGRAFDYMSPHYSAPSVNSPQTLDLFTLRPRAGWDYQRPGAPSSLAITKGWHMPKAGSGGGQGDRRVGFRQGESRYLTTAWYADRLGVPCSQPDGEDFDACGKWDRLTFYLRELVDCGPWSTAEEPITRFAAFFGPSCRRVGGRLEPDDGEWWWTAPRRDEYLPPGYDHPGPVKHGTAVSLRLILGHLWRSRLCCLLGEGGEPLDPSTLGSWEADDAPVDLSLRLGSRPVAHLAVRLHARLTAPDCSEELRRLVLGSSGTPATGLTPESLLLPRPDHWWWLSASTDGLRAIVVDLDRKKPEDEAHFQARLKAMTSPGMPQPHLICTSRGRGRHLWYLVQDRAASGYNGAVRNASRYARVFADRLRAQGVWVGQRSVEIFPASNSAKVAMPPFPFGPRNRLCTPDGLSVVASDPIDCISAWFHSCWGAVRRYTLDDFRGATVGVLPTEDRKLIARPPPSLRHGNAEDVELDDGQQTPHDSVDASAAHSRKAMQTAARRCAATPPAYTTESARLLYERGAQRGATFGEIPVVARHIKFSLRPSPPRSRPDAQDVALFRRWIEPVIEPSVHDHSWTKYQSQFRSAFNGARQALVPDHTPSLTPADVRMIIDVLPAIARVDPRDRAALFRVFAFVVGMARTAAPTGSGEVIGQVSTKMLQNVWKDRYVKPLNRLKAARLVRQVRVGERPTFSGDKVVLPGLVGEYAVVLPQPDDDPVRLSGPDALVSYLETCLEPTVLTDFFKGSRDWCSLFGRVNAGPRKATP